MRGHRCFLIFRTGTEGHIINTLAASRSRIVPGQNLLCIVRHKRYRNVTYLWICIAMVMSCVLIKQRNDPPRIVGVRLTSFLRAISSLTVPFLYLRLSANMWSIYTAGRVSVILHRLQKIIIRRGERYNKKCRLLRPNSVFLPHAARVVLFSRVVDFSTWCVFYHTLRCWSGVIAVKIAPFCQRRNNQFCRRCALCQQWIAKSKCVFECGACINTERENWMSAGCVKFSSCSSEVCCCDESQLKMLFRFNLFISTSATRPSRNV